MEGPIAGDADAAELCAQEAAADEAAVEEAAQEEAAQEEVNAAVLTAGFMPLSAVQARDLLRMPVRHGGKGKNGKGKNGKGKKRGKVLRDNIRTRHTRPNPASSP